MRVTVTTSSSCEPTAHKEGCKDLHKVRKRFDYETEYSFEASSLAEISLDYWTDIIHSDHNLEGEDAIQMAIDYMDEIDIAPCVNLPFRDNGAS